MQTPDPGQFLSSLAAGGMLVIVLFLIVQAAAIALGIWITYTIIWRAVRRGLREFHSPSSSRPVRRAPESVTGPRNWTPPGW